MKTLTTNSASNSSAASKNFFAVLVLIVLTLSFTASLRSQYAQQWAVKLNSPNYVENTKIIKDAANNLYTYGGNILAKYTSGGANVWTRTLSKTIWAMALDSSGNIYVTGQEYTTNSYSIFFKKYNNSGTEMLSKTDNAGMNFSYSPVDITVDNSGNIYILCNYYNMSQFHSNSAELYKFDPAGSKLWTKSLNYNSGSRMITGPSGNIVVAGSRYSYYGGFPTYSMIYECNPSGDILNSGKLDSGYIADIAFDNAGNIYATGRATVKFNSAWVKQWEVMNGFVGMSIKPDGNGNIMIAGSTYYGGSLTNAATAKLSSNGQISWIQYYNGAANGEDGISHMQLLQNGDILVCGTSEVTSGNLDFFLARYSQAGALLRTNFYNGSGNGEDAATSMVIMGNDVVLCGISRVNSVEDVEFVKFADVTGISQQNNQIAEGFSLSQNYPNPFNPSTKISFSIPKASFVKMAVYDVTGKEVEVLVNENISAGSFEVDFNASKLTSGVYFCKITAGDFTDVKKMILTK